MAEFIVVTLFVLAPLFYGVTLIGKYIENRQKAEMAARYSAWERTVWYQNLPKTLADAGIKTKKDIATIGREAQNRVFSGKNVAVYLAQGDAKTIETYDPNSNLNWASGHKKQDTIYKPAGESKFFITATEEHKKSYGRSSDFLDKMFTLTDKLGSFDFNMDGVYASKIEVNMAIPLHFEKAFDDVNVVSTSNTLLTDGWNAGGPNHIKEVVGKTSLIGQFNVDWFNKVRDVLAVVPVAKELHSDSLIFGHVEIDAVPVHKLEQYK